MAFVRDFSNISKISNLHRLIKILNPGSIQNQFGIITVRTKHWNPKYKWLRRQKIIVPELPNFDDKTVNRKEEYRTRMKELGIKPPRYWKTRPLTITSLSEIIDPYVPPEGDGKASVLSKEGSKAILSGLNKKRESMFAIRKIKSYDGNFDVKLFPQEAQDIYIQAHTLLMNKDPEELVTCATETAIFQMMDGLKYKTLRWKFIESLEPPVVVHARAEKVIVDTNYFAQLTVRFHTKQSLAIYDRFGRLCYGSEILAKDVLEYVVFEKHIVNEYGIWRLHGKIIPEWMSPSEPSARTYRLDDEIIEDDMEDFVEEDQIVEQQAEVEVVKSQQ